MTIDSNSLNILLVEDDARLAALTRDYLAKHGAVVTLASDGIVGLQEALRGSYDVVLLDLMLPGRDGIEVCQKLREHRDVPVIMITARGEEADRVIGLEIGADDYMPKPFSPRELLARIRAVVRRARGQAGPRRRTVRVGDVVVDPGAMAVTAAGVVVELTSYEFSLLYALVEAAGRVLTREQLMEMAGGNPEESFDRSIDVHVSRLRKKLGEDLSGQKRIRTVRGMGYVFATTPGDIA